jgi:hypothetical protein
MTHCRVALADAGLAVLVLLAATPAPPHELHETYADLAIEGDVVGGRLRFFKEQLERALGPAVDADAVSLAPGAEADALVLRYLEDRLIFVAHGDTLRPTILRSGEVRMEHHAGWEVTLTWQATAPVDALRVRNTLLFEVHDDQRNIMRFVRFPEETRETVTTEPGAEDVVLIAERGRSPGRRPSARPGATIRPAASCRNAASAPSPPPRRASASKIARRVGSASP